MFDHVNELLEKIDRLEVPSADRGNMIGEQQALLAK
jgi:hypothetical protein